MNRLFSMVLWTVTGLLALALAGLVLAALLECGRTSAMRPPDTAEILFAVRLTLLTATCAAALAVAVSLPVAYLFARRTFRGKAVLDTLLDLPLVLSPVALGAMLLIFFRTPAGRALEHAFGPFVFSVKGIVLAQFLVVVALSIRLLKTTFEGVDTEFEDLARTLGCSPFRAFRRVVLPLSRHGILAAFLLTWARAAGEFGATVTLAGAIPFKTETIPVAIYLGFESADVATMLVFILILVVISLGTLLAVRSSGVFRYE